MLAQVLAAALACAAPGLNAFGRHWLGKTTYVGVCARCHGPDGNDLQYSNIKTLGGLGKRIGEPELRRRLPVAVIGPNEYVIRGYTLTRRELDALLEYVGKL